MHIFRYRTKIDRIRPADSWTCLNHMTRSVITAHKPNGARFTRIERVYFSGGVCVWGGEMGCGWRCLSIDVVQSRKREFELYHCCIILWIIFIRNQSIRASTIIRIWMKKQNQKPIFSWRKWCAVISFMKIWNVLIKTKTRFVKSKFGRIFEWTSTVL